MLDAALIVDELKKLRKGQRLRQDALDACEVELFGRVPENVLKSRCACLDAHSWKTITDDTLLTRARVRPASALRTHGD